MDHGELRNSQWPRWLCSRKDPQERCAGIRGFCMWEKGLGRRPAICKPLTYMWAAESSPAQMQIPLTPKASPHRRRMRYLTVVLLQTTGSVGGGRRRMEWWEIRRRRRRRMLLVLVVVWLVMLHLEGHCTTARGEPAVSYIWTGWVWEIIG